MNINELESQVLALPDADDLIAPEYVGNLLMNIDNAQRTLRDTKKQLEAWMLGWLPTVGGELIVGDIRYFAGYDKDTLSGAPAEVMTALFTHTGGDIEQVAGCLCSQPFKPSACVKVLPPDVYHQLFTTVVKRKAQHEPVKKIQAINTRFIK